MNSKSGSSSRQQNFDAIGRFDYLQELVTEFQDTNSVEAKEQVLANLANFAYDPVNYELFRRLNIIDLFLDQISESNPKLIEFAIGGICNLCLDRENKEHIINNNGVQFAIQCLSSPQEETVLSAITTLTFLVTPNSKPVITSPAVVDCMLRFSKSSNRRLSNLALVFLEDYCTDEQIKEAESSLPVPSSS